MIFKEKKTQEGYQYQCEDVFGHVELVSSTRLDGDMLDSVVSLLLKQNLSAEKIEGEVKHDKGFVKYVLTPENTWKESEEHDDDESWNDTPTSTKQPESASTARGISLIANALRGAWRWSRKFVEAFREAWRKAGK